VKGNNLLILNEATMKEALQFWLDSVVVGQAPEVTQVSVSNTSLRTFEITLVSALNTDTAQEMK
jgi:hypothetical protein